MLLFNEFDPLAFAIGDPVECGGDLFEEVLCFQPAEEVLEVDSHKDFFFHSPLLEAVLLANVSREVVPSAGDRLPEEPMPREKMSPFGFDFKVLVGVLTTLGAALLARLPAKV